MYTSRDDRNADAPHPPFFHSDRSPRGGDGEKPGRAQRRPRHKGRDDGAFSDDLGRDRRGRPDRKGSRRGPAGYDRRSGHDRLRDYPRRHDWHDPADDLDDDELLD